MRKTISRKFLSPIVYLLKEKLLIFILVLGFLLRIILLGKLPHLYIDELWYGTLSLDIKEYGLINYLFDIPFLMTSYVGPYLNFLLLFSLEILGKNILSLRLPTVIVGILTIFLTYKLMKKIYSKRAAVLVSFILAVLPIHVYFSRVGLELIWVPFLAILSLYFINEYEVKKDKRYLYLFAFVCGIGITFKLNFLFFLMGLILGWCILKYPNLKNLTIRDYIFLFFLFLIGTYPLIKLNLYNQTQSSPFANFPITVGGDNLLNVPQNIAGGVQNFTYLYDLWYIPLFCSFGCILLYILLDKSNKISYDKLFQILFVSIFIFASTITLNKFTFSDFIILSPFLSIIIGRSLDIFFSFIKNKKKIFLSLFLIIVFVIFSYTNHYSFFYKWTSKSEDYPHLRIYTSCAEGGKELAEAISESNVSNVIIGEEDRVGIVLKWQKYKSEFFNISHLEDTEVKLKNSLYIISSADCFPYYKRYEEYSQKFMEITKERGLTPEVWKELKNECGDTIFTIYKVVED